MWNILIVFIIAIVIFMINPFKNVSFKESVKQEQKTKNEVNQVVNDVQQQVDYARQMGINEMQQEQQTQNNQQ